MSPRFAPQIVCHKRFARRAWTPSGPKFGSAAPYSPRPKFVAMCVATSPAITPLLPAVLPTTYLTPEFEESSPSILAPRRGTGMWLFNGSPEQDSVADKRGRGAQAL